MINASIARTRQPIAPHQILRLGVGMVLVVVLISGLALHWGGFDLIAYLPSAALCPLRALTGIPCPGCGMTRALLYLGQLNFGKAMAYNLFSIPLLAVMILYLGPGKLPIGSPSEGVIGLALAAVVLVWLLRLMGI
ncbi:MAG: DUF2752 domain-containing protein [Desulfobacterales bacterium]|nr:MAG: DUF2752 domain-containing protein [Desulfobacterales bacterium]